MCICIYVVCVSVFIFVGLVTESVFSSLFVFAFSSGSFSSCRCICLSAYKLCVAMRTVTHLPPILLLYEHAQNKPMLLNPTSLCACSLLLVSIYLCLPLCIYSVYAYVFLFQFYFFLFYTYMQWHAFLLSLQVFFILGIPKLSYWMNIMRMHFMANWLYALMIPTQPMKKYIYVLSLCLYQHQPSVPSPLRSLALRCSALLSAAFHMHFL